MIKSDSHTVIKLILQSGMNSPELTAFHVVASIGLFCAVCDSHRQRDCSKQLSLSIKFHWPGANGSKNAYGQQKDIRAKQWRLSKLLRQDVWICDNVNRSQVRTKPSQGSASFNHHWQT
jgi:hypothetical protein